MTDCIRAVATNRIRDPGPEYQGELLNIALKAMQTRQQDRYPDVIAFQDAIREYRSHAESITLASRAQEELGRGQQNRDYKDLSRATFGFEEAIALWPGNEAARQGLAKTKLVHAQAAYENGDFDLGLSILDPDDETHQPTFHKLQQGLQEREKKNSRLILFKRAVAAMLVFILVGGTIALYLINDQRKKAQSARQTAEQNRIQAELNLVEAERQEKLAKANAAEAEANAEQAKANAQEAERNAQEALKQKLIAEANEVEAISNKEQADENKEEAIANAEQARKEKIEADLQRERAIANAQEALAQKQKAEYEVYLSQIGLAKARIERNEFDDARRILSELKSMRGAEHLGWEWRWLWRQAHQSQTAERIKAAAVGLAINRSGRSGAVILEDGSVELISLGPSGHVTAQSNFRLPADAEATAVAISEDNQYIAVGTRAGEILIWDPGMSRLLTRLGGHEDRITDLQFSPRGTLISGSIDRTARIWDPAAGKQLAACWHIAPVQQVAVAQRDGRVVLVAAVADSLTGRAVVWQLTGSSSVVVAERIGEFLEHDRPVSSLAISRQADRVATGDVAGNILVWRPDDVAKTDYADAITAAVREIKDERSPAKRTNKQTPFTPLIDASDSITQLVSVSAPGPRPVAERLRAHDDIVESLRFSDDGRQLLSASDDYTLKLWELGSNSLAKTLRGHGGWVTDATFIDAERERIMSVSRDATIRLWDASSYVGDVAMLTRNLAVNNNASSMTQPHSDEIWSARFDPSGQRIVSASRDHTARILQIDPATMAFNEVALLRDSDSQPAKLEEGTSFLAMSVVVDRPHGRLYIGSADSTVRVWDLVQGNEIGRATGTGLNNALALSANGRRLLTGSSSPDIKAILWEVDPAGTRRRGKNIGSAATIKP